MSTFPMVSLFITLITILSVAASPKHKLDKPLKTLLVDQVCADTTDDHFCHQAFYSDPRTPTADRIMIAYIMFGKTYTNMTNTQAQIQSKIIEFRDDEKSGILKGLKSCMDKYGHATDALAQMLGNMDSESYEGLDTLSNEALSNVRGCEASFDETTTGSPMTKVNEDLVKLTEICYVVSQLFV